MTYWRVKETARVELLSCLDSNFDGVRFGVLPTIIKTNTTKNFYNPSEWDAFESWKIALKSS